MAKKTKTPVGACVRIEEKWSKSVGVVTESFDDTIQIYGVGYKDTLDFHEFDLSEVLAIVPMEKDRVKFAFELALRDLEQKTMKAEVKYKELTELLSQDRAAVVIALEKAK